MTDTTKAEALAAFTPNPDLQHIPEVKEGYVLSAGPVRWKPYKPGYQGNRKGRWQAMNEYGGWENCETPAEVWPELPDYRALSARLAAVEAERDLLRAKVEAGERLIERLVPMLDDDPSLYEQQAGRAALTAYREAGQ